MQYNGQIEPEEYNGNIMVSGGYVCIVVLFSILKNGGYKTNHLIGIYGEWNGPYGSVQKYRMYITQHRWRTQNPQNPDMLWVDLVGYVSNKITWVCLGDRLYPPKPRSCFIATYFINHEILFFLVPTKKNRKKLQVCRFCTMFRSPFDDSTLDLGRPHGPKKWTRTEASLWQHSYGTWPISIHFLMIYHDYSPIGSSRMPYMVTFTINIPPMLAYIPYMDPMGHDLPFKNDEFPLWWSEATCILQDCWTSL